MQFSVNLFSLAGLDADSLIAGAQLAEELGYEEVWVGDHVVRPLQVTSKYPYTASGQSGTTTSTSGILDPFVTLAAVAAQTRRIRLGVSVLIVPYRNPVITAKLLTSVDILSNGRLDVGIGSGWMAEEFEALGTPFEDRGRRTDEYLQLYRALWTEDPVSFEGRFYRLNAVSFQPKPLQKPYPPIWVGGNSAAALRRLVEFGDAWQPINISAAQLPGYLERILALCRERGRNFDEIKIAINRGVWIVGDQGQIRSQNTSWRYHPLVGTEEQVVDELRRYRALGVHQLYCHFMAGDVAGRRADLTRFAREIRPAVER